MRSITRLACPLVMIAACAAAAPARAPVGGSLAHVITILTDEAAEARASGELPRSTPDVAVGLDPPPAPEAVAERLTRPAHREPFVDAYVRWQLTSFDAALPALSDRDYERLLDGLPALLPDPRADRELIRALTRVAEAGRLDEREEARVRARLDELSETTSRAGRLNRPAMELRQWVIDQQPPTGARAMQATLERCAALVEAGWNADAAKRELETLAAASSRDRDFTDEQRRRVATLATRLVGRSRLRIASARISDGALVVDFADTGIYDFEVRRWLRLVEGRE